MCYDVPIITYINILYVNILYINLRYSINHRRDDSPGPSIQSTFDIMLRTLWHARNRDTARLRNRLSSLEAGVEVTLDEC